MPSLLVVVVCSVALLSSLTLHHISFLTLTQYQVQDWNFFPMDSLLFLCLVFHFRPESVSFVLAHLVFNLMSFSSDEIYKSWRYVCCHILSIFLCIIQSENFSKISVKRYSVYIHTLYIRLCAHTHLFIFAMVLICFALFIGSLGSLIAPLGCTSASFMFRWKFLLRSRVKSFANN